MRLKGLLRDIVQRTLQKIVLSLLHFSFFRATFDQSRPTFLIKKTLLKRKRFFLLFHFRRIISFIASYINIDELKMRLQKKRLFRSIYLCIIHKAHIWYFDLTLARYLIEETVPNMRYLAHSTSSYLRGLCQVSFVGKNGGRRSLARIVFR